MPFVVDEKGKENVVPVRLLSKERLVFLDGDCVIGNRQGNAWLRKQRKKGKNEHPSLVLLGLSVFSYVLHILSGYALQVGTDAIPRDESADGRQMLVFTEFLVGAGHSHACI